ncbi:Calmodulin-lysine N-methyltransferase [Araneus ventricosus]|uniref:Calmodulin-lysine N-methyltransferase n=1 Tax=Araneus ventricosus TaxID=182803 RepID=A0A4Y2FFP0_ARAVE|nr:Calmodulin-lysine N-methyltransferase [Araneus ventricosus]
MAVEYRHERLKNLSNNKDPDLSIAKMRWKMLARALQEGRVQDSLAYPCSVRQFTTFGLIHMLPTDDVENDNDKDRWLQCSCLEEPRLKLKISKRRLHPEPEIKLYGQVINVVSEVKFLGIIFDKKLTFLPHVIQLRKKLHRALNILKVLSNTSWGASRLSLRVYRATILSKIDYGCTIYGSARQSVLQKLNTIHHSALRLCSGAFRTSPVESLYVECHEPSLEHRRQMLTLHYFSKILTNPNHPYFNYKQSRFLQRLQDARPSVVPSFFTRAAGFLHNFNLDTAQLLPNPVILLTPWIPHGFKFLNPFENYDKTNTASDIYLQLYTHHRELYHHFIPVFTDGSKTTTQTSFASVFINSTLSFQLHPSCSIFTAEIRAILRSLSEISNYPADNYIIYSDSLSVLQALSSLHRHSHPLAFSILDLHDRLVCKGLSILLCWVPSHVGISGNEIADITTKNASAVLDNSTPLKDFKRYINLALHSRWENHWNSQSMNKLRSIKPVVETWPTLTNRKADTIISRLRVGHTRYTHRHLLMLLSGRITCDELKGFDNTGNVCIWPSEEVLTYYCMKNKELFGGNSVCELGGGMACLSGLAIAATAGAKEVFVTDGNMRCVENVKCIIEQNRQYFGATHVVSRLLRWDVVEDLTDLKARFDVVICADCLYYDDGRHALAETIWKILKVDGVAVILAPTRGKTFQYFVDIVEKDFMVERLMAYDTHVWELNCRLKEAKSSVYDEDLHYPQMLILRKF